MLFVALVVVGVQRINQHFTVREWLAFAALGVLLATIAALAYACAISRWRLIYAPLLVVAIAFAARVAPALCGTFSYERLMECLAFGRASTWSKMQMIFALEIVYSGMAALLIVVTLLMVFSRINTAAMSIRRSARVSLAALALASIVPLTWLYGQMLWLTPIPPPFAWSHEIRPHFGNRQPR